jgi:predicted NUDIX family phosphoesterase
MEFVYVVPRELLFPHCYPHGLQAFGEDLRREEFEERALEHGFFVERPYAERSPHLKQIIPYAVVCCGDEVLMVRRLNKGGESRLHDKLSIGIGGHINPVDGETKQVEHLAAGGEQDLFTAATARELHEELAITGDFTARAVGLLNDDSNPVGAVHLGLVQVVQVRGSVTIREVDQLEGRLMATSGLQALRADGANFETWSALLVDSLDELIPHSPVSCS